MVLTKAEKRKLKKQKRLEAQRQFTSEKNKTKTRNKIFIYSSVLIVILIAAYSFISDSKKPGYYDDFAKCLTEKGMIMYGAEWCTYTAGQKEMFGKSVKYLNYKDFAETTGVSSTPTWEFEGERYPRVQSFERLSEISGCPLR